MGQVFKKTYLKNGKTVESEKWYVRLWYKDQKDGTWKRMVEAVSRQKKAAERRLKKLETEAYEGKLFERKKPPQTTFEKMMELYLDWSKLNKRSWGRDVTSAGHLVAFFGGMKPAEIHPLLIERYKRERVERVSRRTVDIELACLKHVFTKAVEWGHAAENPVRKVRLFKPRNERTRFLSEVEIVRLLEACADYFRPVVLTAVHTGMRRGELLGLKWEDVDFAAGFVNLKRTKNGDPRSVPMDDTVLEALKTLKKKSSSEYVFVQKGDGTRPLRDVRKPLKRALDKAGLKDVVFHTFRHTAASHLVMKGVDLKTVQEILGHRTLVMTQRYSHLSPAHMRDAVRTLDSIGRAMGTTMGTGEVFADVVDMRKPK
jgi:integrase